MHRTIIALLILTALLTACSGTPAEQLQQEASMDVSYTATYDAIVRLGKTEVKQEMTMYMLRKGDEQQMRIDIPVLGKKIMVFVFNSTSSATCMTSGTRVGCKTFHTSEEVPVNQQTQLEEFIAQIQEKFEVLGDGEITAAGRTGDCYKLVEKNATNDSIARMCFADGVLLAMSTDLYDQTLTQLSPLDEADLDLPEGAVPLEDLQREAMQDTIESMKSNPCGYCDYMEGEDRASCIADCEERQEQIDELMAR
jgi:outer membrane lipoprotein-sorting protein